jgi:hypothetical protein
MTENLVKLWKNPWFNQVRERIKRKRSEEDKNLKLTDMENIWTTGIITKLERDILEINYGN